MADIGLEARADLLEGFLLVAEEREGRRGAVLVDVRLVELGRLETWIVEHQKLGILGGGLGSKGRERGGAEEGGDLH